MHLPPALQEWGPERAAEHLPDYARRILAPYGGVSVQKGQEPKSPKRTDSTPAARPSWLESLENDVQR